MALTDLRDAARRVLREADRNTDAFNALRAALEDETALTDAQLHTIGMAVATLEAAIGDTPDAFRTGMDHAAIVGDALIFALAMKGFVVDHDHVRAAAVARSYEHDAEPTARLS